MQSVHHLVTYSMYFFLVPNRNHTAEGMDIISACGRSSFTSQQDLIPVPGGDPYAGARRPPVLSFEEAIALSDRRDVEYEQVRSTTAAPDTSAAASYIFDTTGFHAGAAAAGSKYDVPIMVDDEDEGVYQLG